MGPHCNGFEAFSHKNLLGDLLLREENKNMDSIIFSQACAAFISLPKAKLPCSSHWLLIGSSLMNNDERHRCNVYRFLIVVDLAEEFNPTTSYIPCDPQVLHHKTIA